MEGDFSNFKKRSQKSIFGLVYNVILLQGPTQLIFSVIVLQKRALIDYSYEHLVCLHNFLYLAFCLFNLCLFTKTSASSVNTDKISTLITHGSSSNLCKEVFRLS